MKKQIKRQIGRQINPSEILTFCDLAKYNIGDFIDFNGLGKIVIDWKRINDDYREITLEIRDKNGKFLGYELVEGYKYYDEEGNEEEQEDEAFAFIKAMEIFFKITAVA